MTKLSSPSRVAEDLSCLPALIDAQVARTPDAIAIVADEASLTYRALDARARRLARTLTRQGVGPDVLVGVCMERSIEMVVALVAVLKAGGAYVPLDPDSPPDRLAFMLDDARVAAVVTQPHLRARIPADRAPIITVDDEPSPEADREALAPLAPRPAPDHLAYAIYTSGSTGRPKGAMNTHRGLVNRLRWMQDEYQLTGRDRVLHKTPFSFDVSVWEFFWPLITGACLIVARPGGHREAAYLVDLIRRQEITTLHFVPSMLGVFLDEPGVEACTTLRRVLCSGEALSLALQTRFFTRSHAELHNLYGPTEASIDVTFWACERDSVRTTVPIGRAIANTQIDIVDARGGLCPDAERGELYIGGVGLARGYLHRPVLTAERFVPSPRAASPPLAAAEHGARAYRTGDLARRLHDGAVEYLGRMDFQVKLPGGLRVELGEIETLARQHPLVQDVAVLATAIDARGATVPLVAYVAPATRDVADATIRAELRAHWARHVPPYMRPSAIVILDALPQTMHGKVDRRALPAPSARDRAADVAGVPPRTATETVLARIWCTLLGVEAVGVEDDFFALGGSSLQAARALAPIRAELGVTLSMRAFYDTPTLAGLAEQIDRARADIAGGPATVRRLPRDGPLALAPQQESWWRSAYLTDTMHPNNVLVGLRVTGPLQTSAIAQAVTALWRRHEPLRTTFAVRDDGSATPVIRPDPPVGVLTMIDLSGQAEATAEAWLHRLSRLEQERPFDLTGASPARATLVRLGPRAHVLLFMLHHLISDGWSTDVLLTELAALYTQAMQGRPAVLPELAFQYVDFAQWQRAWLASRAIEPQLAYWRRQLAPPWPDLLPPVPSDTDTPCFSVRGRIPVLFDTRTTEAARRLAREERCTLFSTIASAVKLVLHAHTGQADVRVGTLVANRGLPGTEHLVGLFTNAVCLRTHVDPSIAVRRLLRQVHATVGEATAHQDLPFDALVQALQAAHGATADSLFQVLVFWRGLPPDPLSFPGAEARVYRRDDEDTVVLVRNTFELKLDLLEWPDAISGGLTYKMTRFSADDMRAFVDMLGRALVIAADQPAITVGALVDAIAPPATTLTTSVSGIML